MKNIAKIFVAAAALICSTGAYAAYPQHIAVTTPQGRNVTVAALADGIIKVTNAGPGEKVKASAASILDERNAGDQLNPDGKAMQAKICGITVTVANDGAVTIDAGPGKKVIDSGMRKIGPDGRRELELTVDAKGSFYGAGERGHKFNLRGDTLTMYNRQNYGYTGDDPRISQMGITMPLFVASDGYAIVFDDFAAAQMILSDPIKYITESSTPVSWYFVDGARSVADAVTALTSLTGRQELPPLWTLGYITSKYGYKTQVETEDVVDSLKSAGYPLDGVILDLYWYGKEQDMGRLAWDHDQWPDPADMLDYLKGRGVHLIPISQPYVLRNGRGIDNYNTLAPKGMLVADSTGKAPQDVTIWVGEGGMLDVSNPQTRAWMADRYKRLTQMGVGGLWGDLGEPEVHPQTAMHHNGLPARQYHNQYGNDWSSLIYNMQKQSFPDRRLITMMRAGTTGLQRYDVFPWSTDVSRSWGGLEPQVRIMLNSGISGLGYMGHDVGGFAVDEANPIDPELYVRWLQLGTFSPMLRTHAQQYAEPFNYPEQEPILKHFIKERYRWLPYNYTLAWENATKGWPLVRPLNFHSTDIAERYDSISDEYLWGRDVLVAPVMRKGAVSRPVTFPKGSDWVDFANPMQVYKGGTTVADYPAPLEVLPLFVRAGSFIPLADYKMTGTRDYNPNKLTIQYYPQPGLLSEGQIFEDDMTLPTTVTANSGRVITLAGDATGKSVAVSMTAVGTYNGASNQKTINLVINGQKKAPKTVELNGRNSRFSYDAATGAVTVAFMWRVDTPMTVVLNFKGRD